MDAIKEYLRAVDRLEHGEINLGEYEKLCEPLRDVVEVKHGEWKFSALSFTQGFKVYSCSNCGVHMEAKFNYCPLCGADMRGKEDEYTD